MKLKLNIFFEDLCPSKAFLPQITVLGNLNFHIEKSWKILENTMKKSGDSDVEIYVNPG